MKNENGKHLEENALLPQVVKLEEAVLGICLLNPAGIFRISEILKPEYFYNTTHQLIYAVIADIDRLNHHVEIFAVIDELTRRGQLEKIGGPYLLTKLTNEVTSDANLEIWAKKIRDKWMLRSIHNLAKKMYLQAYRADASPEEIMQQLHEGLDEINSFVETTKSNNYAELVMARVMEIIKNDGTKPPGLLSGFLSLDRLMIAFFPGQLYVFAARPSMGKTAFLVQLVENLTVVRQGQVMSPIGFLELETSGKSYIDRHVANKTGIDSARMKKGGLTEAQHLQLNNAGEEIVNQKIIADFISSMDDPAIRNKAFAWKRQFGIQALLIDYLQIIEPAEKDQRKNREQQVSKIAANLHALSKDLNIPVIVFAQLSRAVLQRAGNRPNLGDLRESGGIENHARFIGFIHRPDYYGIKEDEFGEALPKGLTEIIVAKNNEGETGTAKLLFDGMLSKFVDLDLYNSGGYKPMEDAPF